MKKLVFAIACIASLASCTERERQRMARNSQVTDRSNEVLVFSGGNVVYRDNFRGIVNQEKESDGIFYFKGDTLVEISGDYVVKSVD